MKRLAMVLSLTAGALLVAASPAYAMCHVIHWVGAPYSVDENAGTVTITASNGAGGAPGGSADYSTVPGTAHAGSDYTAVSGTLTWATGTSEQSFQVPIVNDSAPDPMESFQVHLSNPTGCVTTLPSDATVSIIDNDGSPSPSPSPTKSHSPSPSPKPTKSKTPTPSPTPTKTKSPTSNPTGTSTPSPGSPTPTSSASSPGPTESAIPAGNKGSGSGLSGGALMIIVAAAIIVGTGAIVVVRRRFLT